MNILRIPQLFLFIAVTLIATPAFVHAAPVVQKNPIFPHKSFVEATAQTYENMPTMGVYTLNFTISATGDDVYLPASTERLGKQVDMRNKGIEYVIYDGADARLSKGTSGSALITDLKAQGGHYKIAKNTTADFTLLVILDAPTQTTSIGETYSVHIEGVRYTLRKPENEKLLEMNGLEKWKTKEINIAD